MLSYDLKMTLKGLVLYYLVDALICLSHPYCNENHFMQVICGSCKYFYCQLMLSGFVYANYLLNRFLMSFLVIYLLLILQLSMTKKTIWSSTLMSSLMMKVLCCCNNNMMKAAKKKCKDD
uniref:Uncharacterized protein n=1 Tax=Octopus bimaculoides TaxID=37653 RepID=A0A0L8G687_OCTBM